MLGIGHAEGLVDELGGDRQPAAPAVLDPGGLMELQGIDEHAVVVEDRQRSSIARRHGVILFRQAGKHPGTRSANRSDRLADRVDFVDDLPHGDQAVSGIGLEHGEHQRAKGLRRLGGHGLRIDRANLVEDLEHVRGRESRPAGGQLVEHHAQREHVAGEGGRLAAGLLRREVAGRAEEALARLGHAQLVVSSSWPPREPAEPPRQAEIEDLHQPVVADHHVLGLQVAMDDSGLVAAAMPAAIWRPIDEQVVQGRHALAEQVRKRLAGNDTPWR